MSRRARQYLGLALLGFLAGLVSWSHLVLSPESNHPVGWRQLAFYAIPWMAWAVTTPAIRVALRRFAPLENASRPSWWGVHLVLFCLGWVGNEALQAFLALAGWAPWYETQSTPFVPLLWSWMRMSFITDLLCYGGAIGVIYALEARSRLRAQEMAAAQLETQLARAQLEALRVQLHPHFLFNTLNAISMMARKGETDVVVRMLAGLSDLLRLALSSVGKAEVPLRAELDFLERYLALQQIRFSDRLQVKMDISPEALEARVPSLVLQPLAENAVRHGLSPQNEGGLLEIGAQRSGAELVLSVRDTGVGLPPESERRGGMGLQNVRARLAVLYPDTHRFTLENHPGGGTLALVTIPFHQEALADG